MNPLHGRVRYVIGQRNGWPHRAALLCPAVLPLAMVVDGLRARSGGMAQKVDGEGTMRCTPDEVGALAVLGVHPDDCLILSALSLGVVSGSYAVIELDDLLLPVVSTLAPGLLARHLCHWRGWTKRVGRLGRERSGPGTWRLHPVSMDLEDDTTVHPDPGDADLIHVWLRDLCTIAAPVAETGGPF